MLEYLEEALEEAAEAARWYAERSPVAAAAFADELQTAAESIQRNPHTWPRFAHQTRRFLLKHFPYSVVYSVKPDRIVIIAVAHAHRRPGYWKDRITR
jgi:plasmid stabilization system protein ParE